MNHQIPISKMRYFIGAALMISFIIIGVIGILNPEQYTSLLVRKEKIVIFGSSIVLIFAFLLVFIIYKMSKHKYGLIINDAGITDNVAGVNYGLIEWDNIEGFGFKTHVMNKFIVIFLKDEDELYIKVKGFKKTNLKFNKDTFGSPLAISTTMLKMKFVDIESLIKKIAEERSLEIY